VTWYVDRISISGRPGGRRCVGPVPGRAALGRRVCPGHWRQAARGDSLAMPDDVRHRPGLDRYGFRRWRGATAGNLGEGNPWGCPGHTCGNLRRRGPIRTGTDRCCTRRRPARRGQPWARALHGHADGFGEYPLRGARPLSGGRGARQGHGTAAATGQGWGQLGLCRKATPRISESYRGATPGPKPGRRSGPPGSR